MKLAEVVRGIFDSNQELARVKRIVEMSENAKPDGYRVSVERMLAYYHECAQPFVEASLKAQFPKSASRMTPVTFGFVPRVAREQARVFGQPGEAFASDSPAWAKVARDSALVQRLKDVDRYACAVRCAFVRVSFDESHDRLRLTIFTPERAHPDGDVDAPSGFVLEVAGQKGKRRLEWYDTTEPDPVVRLVSEDRKILRTDALPYRLNDHPIIPIVRFGTTAADVDAWPMPNANRLAQAQAIDAAETSSHFVAKMTGFPQFTGRNTDPDRPSKWDTEIEIGPDTVMRAPHGAEIGSIDRTADTAGHTAWRAGFMIAAEASESLPPGSVLSDGTRSVSGVALTIERAPLTELRQDHAEAYRPSVARLLDVMLCVWNTHHPGAPIAGPVEWTEGAFGAPVGDEEQARIDSAEIANGTSSPVRVLMRKFGITREAAIALAAEISEENQSRTAGMLNDAGAKVFDVPTKDDAAEDAPPQDGGARG